MPFQLRKGQPLQDNALLPLTRLATCNKILVLDAEQCWQDNTCSGGEGPVDGVDVWCVYVEDFVVIFEEIPIIQNTRKYYWKIAPE